MGAEYGESSSDHGCCFAFCCSGNRQSCSRSAEGYEKAMKSVCGARHGWECPREAAPWQSRCVHSCARRLFVAVDRPRRDLVSRRQGRGLRRFLLLRFLSRSRLTFLYHRQWEGLRISGRRLMDSVTPVLLRCRIHRCRRTFAILSFTGVFFSFPAQPSVNGDQNIHTHRQRNTPFNHAPNFDSHDSSWKLFRKS